MIAVAAYSQKVDVYHVKNLINVVDVPILRTAEEAERRYLRATPLVGVGR